MEAASRMGLRSMDDYRVVKGVSCRSIRQLKAISS